MSHFAWSVRHRSQCMFTTLYFGQPTSAEGAIDAFVQRHGYADADDFCERRGATDAHYEFETRLDWPEVIA